MNEVIEELDEIHRGGLQKNKKRKGVRPPTKRVFIGRVDNSIPNEKALSRLFPFMIDDKWFHTHLKGTDQEDELREATPVRDPPGFGTRIDEPDGSDDYDEDEDDE